MLSPLEIASRYSLPELHINARTTLLREGERATCVYIIQQGCLRLWLNNDGVEITNQFFVEGRVVASLESFITGQPSALYLEAIEKSTVYVLGKEQFDDLLRDDAEFAAWFHEFVLQRFIYYSRHLLSFLRDKPEARYRNLLDREPGIVQRVPQHYIASYLGITPVSLSRIKNKVLRGG